jgi:hypothetical protein
MSAKSGRKEKPAAVRDLEMQKALLAEALRRKNVSAGSVVTSNVLLRQSDIALRHVNPSVTNAIVRQRSVTAKK